MKTVLLVDDDETSNFLMGKLLERTGLADKIKFAVNGVQAIDILREARHARQQMPDVIFLDLNMPIMNGFDFLEVVSKIDLLKKEETKIVIVSSSENNHDIQKARKMGINDFVVKPVSEEKLRSLLQK